MHFSGIYFGNGLAIVVPSAGRFASCKDIPQTTLVALTKDLSITKNSWTIVHNILHIAICNIKNKLRYNFPGKPNDSQIAPGLNFFKSAAIIAVKRRIAKLLLSQIVAKFVTDFKG